MIAVLTISTVASVVSRKQERGVTCPPHPEAVKNLISYLS